MNKLFTFLLIAVSLFVSIGLDSKTDARKSESAPFNPTATPTPKPLAEIEKLELDRTDVLIPCPPGSLPQGGATCDDNRSITVRTITGKQAKIAAISYQYTVSGGNVLGQSETVIWDLSEARPGTYTISVIVNNNEKDRKTATVTVRNCNCGGDCFCPMLSVLTSTESVNAGDTVSFGANVSGGTASDITYNWTISSGEIIDGQGTPTINVKTNSAMIGSQLKATVEIGGDGLCADCPRTESKTVSITR